jgi:hypothetical protein
MTDDVEKLPPCRFCGEQPFCGWCFTCPHKGALAAYRCPSCGHECKDVENDMNSARQLWIKRNQKNNPFIKEVVE